MSEQPDWWRIHDILVGGLAGAAVGVIIGLFGLRLVDHPAAPPALGLIGAAAGIVWLGSRRGPSQGFFTTATAVAWATIVVTVGFLAALGRAIATFN